MRRIIITRINVIDPSLLSNQHLAAEYRELPRIFGLVKEAIKRGEHPNDKRNPKEYMLGTGHCRFFYSRLGYLAERYNVLCEECRKRGRAVNYGDVGSLVAGIPVEWMGRYTPTAKAVEMNIERINNRGGLRE